MFGFYSDKMEYQDASIDGFKGRLSLLYRCSSRSLQYFSFIISCEHFHCFLLIFGNDSEDFVPHVLTFMCHSFIGRIKEERKRRTHLTKRYFLIFILNSLFPSLNRHIKGVYRNHNMNVYAIHDRQ